MGRWLGGGVGGGSDFNAKQEVEVGGLGRGSDGGPLMEGPASGKMHQRSICCQDQLGD